METDVSFTTTFPSVLGFKDRQRVDRSQPQRKTHYQNPKATATNSTNNAENENNQQQAVANPRYRHQSKPAVSQPVTSCRTFLRYGERLEQFIFTHKTRPPDFKFWPYGPYWLLGHVGPVVETPRLLRNFDFDVESLWSSAGRLV